MTAGFGLAGALADSNVGWRQVYIVKVWLAWLAKPRPIFRAFERLERLEFESLLIRS